MNTGEKILLAVLVGFAVLVWILPVAAGVYMDRQTWKKRGEPADDTYAKYDERQKLIRLEASQHALYALGIYLLLWIVLEMGGGILREDMTLPLLLGALALAWVVWSGECILRGAMIGINQRKSEGSQIIVQLALGACTLELGASSLLSGESQLVGQLAAVQMLFGGSFVILGGLMAYARHKRKQAEREPDTGDGEA